MKWHEGSNVKFHDTNSHEVVGPSHILKFMQETSMRHMKGVGPSYEALFNQNKVFVLSSIRIEMYNPIYAYQDVDVYTWACPSRGFSFMRSYSIEANGEIMAEAHSTWALVNTEDRRLYRVGDIDISSYGECEPVTLEHPIRFRIPNEVPLSLVGEYTVSYSDTDINGHMNNTNYPDMLLNCLTSPEKVLVKSLAISFISEIKRGDYIKIYTAKTDGKYYFRSIKEDGSTNIEAEMIVESI